MSIVTSHTTYYTWYVRFCDVVPFAKGFPFWVAITVLRSLNYKCMVSLSVPIQKKKKVRRLFSVIKLADWTMFGLLPTFTPFRSLNSFMSTEMTLIHSGKNTVKQQKFTFWHIQRKCVTANGNEHYSLNTHFFLLSVFLILPT